MNNINQKNVIQKLNSNTQVPYLCADFISLYDVCENTNVVEMNNIAQQLLDNDLYLEAALNDASAYSIGPKLYDETTIAWMPNGYKVFGDIKSANCLDILRKVDDPLSSTLKRVSSTSSAASFLCQYGSKIFSCIGGKLVCSEDPITKEFVEVKTTANGTVNATNWYIDNDNLFFCTSNNAYQLSTIYDVGDDGKTMVEKMALVQLLKSNVDTATLGTVNSIAVSTSRRSITLGTSKSKVLAGRYSAEVGLDSIAKTISLSAQDVQIPDGPDKVVRSMHYFPDKQADLYLGVDNGLYQEQLSAGLEGQVPVSKPAGVTSLKKAKWFNNTLYVGTTNGLYKLVDAASASWEQVQDDRSQPINESIVDIIATRGAMYVATSTKVFKITASYVTEQTASNANADVLAGKTFSALATIRDEVIFVGTTTGEVFYYTPNDVIYLEQLAVGATTAIVGLVCTDQFINIATSSKVYCFEVNSLNLVKTSIVKDKIAHSTGGIALDSEIKKIFKISNRTFIATSSKIFSLDGRFQWRQSGVAINAVEVFKHDSDQMIAVAGSTKSFVIYVTGGTSYTAIEVTSNGSVPAIDVAATNDIVVFLGSSSKATVVDLTKNIRYQSPAQVSLGGNFTQLESFGKIIYGQNDSDNKIYSIVKYLPSQKSEIADGRAVNAFVADSQANVGLVATDNGISCISAAYSIEADGDVLTSLTASWIAKPTKSFLVTNIDQYNDVVLLGTTSNGICSAFLDEVDGDLGSVVTKLNGATKIAGSPNNATSMVETSQSSGKKIFAAASDGKIYSQSVQWASKGNASEFGPGMKSFMNAVYFTVDDVESTQQVYSCGSTTEFKRNGTATAIDSSRAATKMNDNPLGVYMRFEDGSLGFWFDQNTTNPDTGTPDAGTPDTGTPDTGTPDTGTPEQTQTYYAGLLGGVLDIACYQYSTPYVVDGDINYLGIQFALDSRHLYKIDVADIAGSEVVYRDQSSVSKTSVGDFSSNAVNCDIDVDDQGSKAGLILVALANGTIWFGDLAPGSLNLNWKSASVSDTLKGAWFVSDGKIAVWTSTNALKVYSLSKNASGNYVLTNGQTWHTSIAKVSKAQARITTYNLFGEVGGNIVEAYSKTTVGSSSNWSGAAFLWNDTTQTYAFSTSSGTTKYQVQAGGFGAIYTGVKYLDYLSDGTTSLMLGVTSGGRLAFNTDGSCTSWTTIPSSETGLIGCSGQIVGTIARIFAWSSSKVYYGEVLASEMEDLTMAEYLDKDNYLGGSAIRGFADPSVQLFTDSTSGKNELINFCTGSYDYNNQIVLVNGGMLYFDGVPSVRVSEAVMSKTNWMTKDNLGRIWVVGHESNSSYPRRVYNQVSDDGKVAKLATNVNITELEIFTEQSDNIAAVAFNNGTVQIGQVSMATDVISLTPVSISGISKITALGKGDGTVVFGAKNSSDSSISLYEFEYFTIHQLLVASNSNTQSLAGFQVQKLVQCGQTVSFNAICKKTDDQTMHLLEYHPNQDRTKSTVDRQFTTKITGVQTNVNLKWLCQLDDDGDQMVLALQLDDDTETLNYTYYNDLQEYENVCIGDAIGFVRAGSKYVVVTPSKLIMFDKHGLLTTYVKIGSSESSAHWRFLAREDDLLVTTLSHLESVDKSGIATIMKAGLSNLRTIATATLNDGIQRWFYLQGRDVWQSTNRRIWKKMFSLKDTSIGVVYDIVPINENIFVFATDKGIYSTCYSWTMVHDVNDFTRDDAFELYAHAKEVYMDPALDAGIASHELEDHGIRSSDEQQVSEQPLIAQLNSKFSSVELDDVEPTWQKQAKDDAAGTLGITNDLIAEMQFGNYNDGVVMVYTSSFINACEGENVAEVGMNEVKDISFIMKRWMSGITDLYINIPSTSSYYLNNLYGASGCRLQPEAAIARDGKLGACGATTGELSTHYTQIVVGIASAEYHVDQLLDIQINGNSLPLEIYKDSSGNAGPSRNLYSSYIEPSLARSWNTTSTDEEGNWLFNFACFGTDAQAIHLMFYDSKARTNAPYIKIVFDSNGGEGEMPKQKFLLIGEDPARYTLEQKTLRKNRFKNDSVGYDKIFAGWSLSPQPDNYSGSDALDGTQVYENTQLFPTSVGFAELMQELGRGSGSSVEGLVKKEEITLYAVWLTYKFSDTDTRLVMNSTKEQFKIGAVGVDESTNLRGTVIIDFGD